MKATIKTITLVLMLFGFSPYSTAILIDVNDYTTTNLGSGYFLYQWHFLNAGIGPLQPDESYSFDIEFLEGQTFSMEPLLPGPSEFISLSFFNVFGDGTDPGLELTSGEALFTGFSGDLNANPVDLTGTDFIPDIGPDSDWDEYRLLLVADLTSDGFSFHDLHFDFTFGSAGEAFPVARDGVVLRIIAFEPVSLPGTLTLLGLGLVGVVCSRRKA